MKLLEKKTTMSEVKIKLDGINSWLSIAEKQLVNLKTAMETIQNEIKKKMNGKSKLSVICRTTPRGQTDG